MADLTSIANRVTDNEVAPNKPITTTLNQLYGSNINFLLDFLGISNGATGTSGTLNDLIAAVEEVSNHTLDLQANITLNSTQSIGTYTKNKFVNQVFYLQRQGAPSQNEGAEHYLYNTSTGASSRTFTFFKNVDAAGNEGFGGTYEITPVETPVNTLDNYRVDQSQVSPVRNDWNNNREFSKALHIGVYNFLNGPLQGDGSGFIDNAILPVVELDYRDPGISTELFMTNNGLSQTYTVWRGKKLNVGFNL